MSKDFVHLHVHSEFSLLDGACRLKDLVKQAKSSGMDSVALTDHGVMYGVIPFYKKAIAEGIKPIIGCEVYLAKDRFDRGSKKDNTVSHLTLLAADMEGYQNLMQMVSIGFLEGFYYRPRIDDQVLKEYHKGIIALSGCMTGRLSQLILADRLEDAVLEAKELNEIFDDGRFYLELQDHGLDGQGKICKALSEISKELSIPTVATNDVHYIGADDSIAQEVMLCIQTGATMEDEDRFKFQSDQLYLKDYAEMSSTLPDYPEALARTNEIADMCDVEIDFGKIYLPNYEVPKDYDLFSYLRKLCEDGIKKRYSNVTDEIKDRLEHELSVIKDTGFAGYFLIVWDFMEYAKENSIRVGPGRGSAAGSIVAYALGITNIDPIKYGLLFERFLNPERVSMPDIDIDFCIERRDEVIDYVTKKYGEDRVAQIITFGTMQARQAIRDAGRVFGVPYSRVDTIAKLVPETLGITLDEALDSSDEFRNEYENNEDSKMIIDSALKLEGMARHDSVHAAGVVISKEELPRYTPLQRKPGTDVVTQYPMDVISSIGLLKMDFLGLRTLTVIDQALLIIKRTTGKAIEVDDIPFDDDDTFEMLRSGDTIGVFQLESSGMRSLIRDLEPSTFTDIIALLALYRPGPLQSGMVKDFCDRKHKKTGITYLHEKMEPILEDTYGIIVYQEQVMRLATDLAGFSMAEADILRGAMSKKKPEVLDEQREKFISGSAANDVDKKTAGKIFDLIVHFAGYGFNKSHSTAYAVISYQTAYFKAHYPLEFMAALLTSVMGTKDKVAQYANECRRKNIDITPPSVNDSFAGFTPVDEGKIRFGLSAVKNVGLATIEKMVEARSKDGSFKSIFDFCVRVDSKAINKRAIDSLIKSGSFDFLGHTRKDLLNNYEQAVDYGVNRQRQEEAGQFSLFGDSAGISDEPIMVLTDEEMSKEDLLGFEKDMLGLYISDNPLFEVAELLAKKTTFSLSQVKEAKKKKNVQIGGLVSQTTKITTRKGDPMMFAVIEDLEGSIEAVIFPNIYQENASILVEDKIILIKGRLDTKEDEVKIIAEEIKELDRDEIRGDHQVVDEKKSILCLNIAPAELDGNMMEKINDILKAHPGQSNVYLKIKDSEKTTTVKFSNDYQVNTSTSREAMSSLLGESSVTISTV